MLRVTISGGGGGGTGTSHQRVDAEGMSGGGGGRRGSRWGIHVCRHGGIAGFLKGNNILRINLLLRNDFVFLESETTNVEMFLDECRSAMDFECINAR